MNIELALANLKLGVFPPMSGYMNNPYREWIGAQMRGVICGQLFPGNITTRIGWKNSCGKLVLGNTTSIVTSGVGVWGPALRIGTDSEVVEVDVTFLS